MICYCCNRPVSPVEPSLEGLHASCFERWFHLEKPTPFQNVIARSSEEEDDGEFARITSSFFHGKFRKYSARLGPHEYILKVEQKEFPELPATEYLCNQIARELGLLVADFYLIRFEGALKTFVCRNFMENHPGGDLVHIYRYLKNPGDYSCEGLLRVLEEQVSQRNDIWRFIELTLFDALIGNHDRHGRNLGLIQSSRRLQLSPFYDNPSYLALEDPILLGAMHEPRGSIPTLHTLEPTMKDYVKEWSRLGYSKICKKFAKQIQLENIAQLIATSFISEQRKAALSRLIQKRYEELSHAL